MIGMVLAAGAGKRLGHETADLPKTLLGVDGDRTILDVALGEPRARRPRARRSIVTGFAADRSPSACRSSSAATASRIELVFNPKAQEWNNAYSLWCARERVRRGRPARQRRHRAPRLGRGARCSRRAGRELVIAVDDEKPLGEEEMKVHVTADGLLDRINKALDPRDRAGRVHRRDADRAGRRRRRWPTRSRRPGGATRRSTTRTASRSSPTAAAGSASRRSARVEWVEVDDHADLARAREVACRC